MSSTWPLALLVSFCSYLGYYTVIRLDITRRNNRSILYTYINIYIYIYVYSYVIYTYNTIFSVIHTYTHIMQSHLDDRYYVISYRLSSNAA